MRHRVKGKKLNRSKASRKALIVNLIKAIIENERIETTLVKAKYVRPEVERIITLAKKNDLANRRRLIQRVGDKRLVAKLLGEIGPKFKNRNGGYTRIRRTIIRKGDMTQMATLSLVEGEKVMKPSDKDVKTKRVKKSEAEPQLRQEAKREVNKSSKSTSKE